MDDEQNVSAEKGVRTVVLDMLSRQESITTAEVVQQSGRSTTVIKYLNEMIDGEGIIEPVGGVNSSKRRYRLTTRMRQ